MCGSRLNGRGAQTERPKKKKKKKKRFLPLLLLLSLEVGQRYALTVHFGFKERGFWMPIDASAQSPSQAPVSGLAVPPVKQLVSTPRSNTTTPPLPSPSSKSQPLPPPLPQPVAKALPTKNVHPLPPGAVMGPRTAPPARRDVGVTRGELQQLLMHNDEMEEEVLRLRSVLDSFRRAIAVTIRKRVSSIKSDVLVLREEAAFNLQRARRELTVLSDALVESGGIIVPARTIIELQSRGCWLSPNASSSSQRCPEAAQLLSKERVVTHAQAKELTGLKAQASRLEVENASLRAQLNAKAADSERYIRQLKVVHRERELQLSAEVTALTAIVEGRINTCPVALDSAATHNSQRPQTVLKAAKLGVRRRPLTEVENEKINRKGKTTTTYERLHETWTRSRCSSAERPVRGSAIALPPPSGRAATPKPFH